MSREQNMIIGQARESGGGGCRKCGLGCLGLLLLGGLVLALLSANASARLDARVTEARQEIVDLELSADARRVTLLGSPQGDQNAVVDYQGLEWVLTVGDEESRRNSWRATRPVLPDDIDAMLQRVSPAGKKHPLDLSSRLLEGISSTCKVDDSLQGRKKRAKALAFFWRVRPALRYVQDGLQRGKCDWKVQWARGMDSVIPNLRTMRTAAELMAYEASLQELAEAFQTGLEIVAFGQDLGRQGTPIGGMIGLSVSSIGCSSLRHTLGGGNRSQ